MNRQTETVPEKSSERDGILVPGNQCHPRFARKHPLFISFSIRLQFHHINHEPFPVTVPWSVAFGFGAESCFSERSCVYLPAFKHETAFVEKGCTLLGETHRETRTFHLVFRAPGMCTEIVDGFFLIFLGQGGRCEHFVRIERLPCIAVIADIYGHHRIVQFPERTQSAPADPTTNTSPKMNFCNRSMDSGSVPLPLRASAPNRAV